MDDNKKKFIPQLAIDTEFFHFSRVCQSLYDVKPKAQSERCAPYCAIVGDGALTLKGSHGMGDGLIFSKNLRASLLYDDLSNEPNFGRIHLAGQYL
jgi:hypothetical protein